MRDDKHPPDDVRDIVHDLKDRWYARWMTWTSVSPTEWVPSVRWGLTAMFALLGLATAWSIWWLIGLPMRATLQRDLGVEQQTLDRANEAAHRLPSLLGRFRDAQADTMAWTRLLPIANSPEGAGTTADGAPASPLPDLADDAHAAWRADLELLVTSAGLTLESARPGPSGTTGNAMIERAEMRVRGTTANLLGWLADIERVPRHLAIERLSLQGPRMGTTSEAHAAGAGRERDTEADLTVMVAAYRWRPSSEVSGVGAPGAHPWPVLPEPVPRWVLPADMIDVFRTTLSRRAAQGAVTMTPSGSSASSAAIDDTRPVGSMRAGSRHVVLRRAASGVTVTWSDGLPRRGRAGDLVQASSVDVMLHGVEAADALRTFARLTGRSVVIGERVAGRLDMEIQGVSAATAFDVMIRSAGLGVQSVGGVDWIAPRADLLADEQTQLEAAAKREALLPLGGRRFTLNYPRALALREIILGEKDRKGQRLLSPRGSVIADPRTNQLFVTDLPERLDALASFITRIDVPVRQVLIEARIVEADDRFSESLGVRLAGYHGRADTGQNNDRRPATADTRDALTTTDAKGGEGKRPGSSLDVGLAAAALAGVTPPSLAITLFGRSATRFLQLELSALETTGRGRVVSRPRVVTADKIQAVIEQGTELPYQTRSARRSVMSVQFRKATLRLEVTPLITPDGQVILDVDVRKDSVGQAVAEGFAVDTRHVKTQVQVENGGTVAIGGIYQEERRDNRASVPWLGEVPLLGALFRNRSNEDRRTELLVFLTPSVVPDGHAGNEAVSAPVSPIADLEAVGATEGAREIAGAVLEQDTKQDTKTGAEQGDRWRPAANPAFPVDTKPALPAAPDVPAKPLPADLPDGHPRLIGGNPEATRSARPTQIPVSSGIGTQISAIYAGKRNTCRTDGGGQDHGRTRGGTTSRTAVL